MKASRTLLAIIIALLPLLYLNFIFPELPDRVPIHFDAQGRADNYASKSGFYGFQFGLAALSIGVFLLIKNGHTTKANATPQTQENFEQLGLGSTVFLSAINFIIIQAALAKDGQKLINYVLLAIPFLFLFLGNYFIRLKPNYFIGIRTPYTLMNEEIWRKTHRLAGRLLVISSLISILPMLYVDFTGKMLIVGGMLAIGFIYPMFYSYQLSRK
ncbi:SdpI family protein [Siphonobacter sp.]|uniref:SdpI family protein n=1 Tax=Siphonobacter sp. TaxID=1869184 RepID=UPI003B3B47EB